MIDKPTSHPPAAAPSDTPDIVVAALYKFAPLPSFEVHREPLQAACEAEGVMGTLLLAAEGINGTIAGSRAGIDAVLAKIRQIPGLSEVDWKESYSSRMPFKRMRVRLKREIVTMGVEGIDPNRTVGTYVAPEDWNQLISEPDVVLIDTRNDYEVSIGTFEGAVNPETQTFREFPGWVNDALTKDDKPKVAMFCTGGIRCEKASALLKDMGFEDVYHLKGGILKYLEQVPPEQSRWNGECFVFDERVSVGHGLEPGPYQLCSICREPFLSREGSGGYAKSPCPTCEQVADARKKKKAAERQRQIDLAKARGQKHMGVRQDAGQGARQGVGKHAGKTATTALKSR
ncbi:MAG: rhodanese-related sulfurtransferase [Alphaproteobacteria bacterium]|nr:rhodanese-related sulfurtransferase [Alphaproteobacteria bacterium]